MQRLEAAQIANAHVNDMHDVWEHPQLQARDRWTRVDTPMRPIPALLPPGKTDAYTARMDAVPGLGEHSESSPQSGGIERPLLPGAAAAIDRKRGRYVNLFRTRGERSVSRA